MSTPTVLPAAALAQLAPTSAPRATTRFLGPAATRAALYLVPVPLAVAAGEPLGRVPWPVPVGAAAAGWCAIQVLGYLGRATALRAGVRPAARLVLAGAGALLAGWSVLLAVAPPALAGDDRALGYAVSLPALVLFAGIAAALATGTAAATLRWSVPALLAAGAAIAGWLPGPGGRVPVEPLLLAGIAVLAIRGLAPALPRRRRPDGNSRSWSSGTTRRAPCRRNSMINTRRGELWRAGTRLALAISQAATVVLVWRAGLSASPPGTVPPAVLPLLLALPLIEICAGWHLAQVAAGLARHDDRNQHLRYLRRLGWATLAGLLPPLIAGVALAGTAYHLPYQLSTHPDAPALVLSMASGVLLAGTIAVGWLLASRDRPGLPAAVTGFVAVGAVMLAEALVIVLAIGYAVGLVLAAYRLVDPRSVR